MNTLVFTDGKVTDFPAYSLVHIEKSVLYPAFLWFFAQNATLSVRKFVSLHQHNSLRAVNIECHYRERLAGIRTDGIVVAARARSGGEADAANRRGR